MDNKNVIKLKKNQQFGYGEEVPSSPKEGSVCSTKRWEQHRQGHQNSSPSQNAVSPRLQTDIHSILTRKWKVMYNILNCHRLTDELLFTCLLACEFYYDPNPINQKQGFRYQKRRFYFAMPKKPYILSKGLSSLYFDGPITWESFVWVLIHSLLISGWYRNFLSHISGPFCSASIKLFKTRKQSYITESTGQLYHCKNLKDMQWCLHTTATAGELRSSNDVIAVR